MRVLLAAVLSILIHIVLSGALKVAKDSRKSGSIQRIEITLQPDASRPSNQTKQGTKRRAQITETKMPLSAFGMTKKNSRLSPGVGIPGQVDRTRDEPSGTKGYRVAEGMDFGEEGKTLGFYQALFKKIDRWLYYPTLFVDHRIEGQVRIQLEVSKDGRFTGKWIHQEADVTQLKVFVMAMLVQALKNAIPEQLWLKDKDRTIIVVNVIFKTYMQFTAAPAKLYPPVFKNILSWELSSSVEPLLNKELERILTRFIPPLIPIAGGFYLDFIRAYQFFENLTSEDLSQEEKAEVIYEKSLEKWQSVVRETAGG